MMKETIELSFDFEKQELLLNPFENRNPVIQKCWNYARNAFSAAGRCNQKCIGSS